MTDREQWRLHGPVLCCRDERRWYSRRCGADKYAVQEGGDATTLEFRFDGNLSRQFHHNPDGSEWTATYEYDTSGRLLQMRTETAGETAKLSFYEYDDAGRLIRVLDLNGADDRIVEIYEYSAWGHKSKTLHVDVAAQHPDTAYGWSVEGTDCAYSARGAANLTTDYNHRDQPTQLLFRDLTGHELSKVEFRYDDAGRLVEEAQTNSERVLPPEMLAEMNPA